MFRKILIANRGEIALRVLSACKELDIRTVAVYSEADRHALHVRFADEAICIGPPRSADSYLNIPQVISAAEMANVDAIHPGYGFLSENANFAEVCEASHITFIGPSPSMIRMMGEKDRARVEMAAAGLPIIPGSDGVVPDEAAAKKVAAEIGLPLMIKAVEGGGGRGMRMVRTKRELIPAFQTARTEAQQAFGSPNVYMEKLIEHPRHIEFQVLGDRHGSVIHLGERECSLQRRHQKVLEESPSPALDAATRERMGKQVVEALHKIGYSNAGTVEFLRDASGNLYLHRDERAHPGRASRHRDGHAGGPGEGADSCRRRRSASKMPSARSSFAATRSSAASTPKTRTRLCRRPGASRLSAFRAGREFAWTPPCTPTPWCRRTTIRWSPSSIAHGRDRAEAIARMHGALDGFVVEGIKTTIPLQKRILAEPDFIAGKFDTHFLDRLTAVK